MTDFKVGDRVVTLRTKRVFRGTVEAIDEEDDSLPIYVEFHDGGDGEWFAPDELEKIVEVTE